MDIYSKKTKDELKVTLEDRVFTVTEFINFVNALFEPLKSRRVSIKGEIGEDINLYPRYGFFKLIDENDSVLQCFAYKRVINEMEIDFEPGMEVKISGYPELRKKKGSFNFQVKRIVPTGEGELKKQFELLKKKLKEKGFFDKEKKQEIPPFAEKIGLITSKGSDAEEDFRTHLKKYGFTIYSYNSKVEGDSAIQDIVSGIQLLNSKFPDLDLIVITRGGGSWESLQAFNSKEVVKSAFSSNKPIISGVGHENDVTLLDLVADMRVSTPTDAGKYLSENWEQGAQFIEQSERNLNMTIANIIERVKQQFAEMKRFFEREIKNEIGKLEQSLEHDLKFLTNQLKSKIEKFYSLEESFRANGYKLKVNFKENKEKVETLTQQLNQNKEHWEETLFKQLSQEREKLRISSPKFKLRQGYSITKKQGEVVKKSSDLKQGDKIKTKLSKGSVKSQVENNE
ncbi:MAG: exodeoxyribonuclease VII large subunit [Candidatus Paceibacterota bacterium]